MIYIYISYFVDCPEIYFTSLNICCTIFGGRGKFLGACVAQNAYPQVLRFGRPGQARLRQSQLLSCSSFGIVSLAWNSLLSFGMLRNASECFGLLGWVRAAGLQGCRVAGCQVEVTGRRPNGQGFGHIAWLDLKSNETQSVVQKHMLSHAVKCCMLGSSWHLRRSKNEPKSNLTAWRKLHAQ